MVGMRPPSAVHRTGKRTDSVLLERNKLRHRMWSRAVYSKDGYLCQMCGVHPEMNDIVAHHVQEFRTNPERRYQITNGLTLCRACHRKVHNDIGVNTRFRRADD